VKFHYPYIFYIYDNNEIWMHKIDTPEVIHRFILINSIASIEPINNVYSENSAARPPTTFVCLLNYHGIFKLGEFSFRSYPAVDNDGVPISRSEKFITRKHKIN
jgi:hypothetical protein